METALAQKSPFVLTDKEIEERLGETFADIAILDDKYKALTVSGVDDETGYKSVHTAKMDIIHRRTKVKKNGLAERKDANDFCNSVLKIEKKIIEKLLPIEEHLMSQEKIVDDEKARIKAEIEEKEAAKREARSEKLFSFGCNCKGTGYVLPFAPDYSVPQAIVFSCPDEQFEQICGEFQKLVDIENKRIADEKAAKLAEEERLTKIKAEQEAESRRLADIAGEQAEKERKIKEAEEKIAKEKQRLIDEENERITAVAREKQRIADEQKRTEELEVAKKEAAAKAVKEAEEKAARELAEKGKKRLAKIEAERQEALQPDKVKLIAFADSIDLLRCPELKDETAIALRNTALKSLTQISNKIRKEAREL